MRFGDPSEAAASSAIAQRNRLRFALWPVSRPSHPPSRRSSRDSRRRPRDRRLQSRPRRKPSRPGRFEKTCSIASPSSRSPCRRCVSVAVTSPHHRLRRGGLTQINRQFEQGEPGDTHKSLSASATAFVKQQPWPGNVRQLYNVLSQAAVLADGATLGRGDLASALGQLPAGGGPHNRRGQVATPSGVSANARCLPCVSSRSMIAVGSHRPDSNFPGFLKPLFPAEFNHANSPSSIGRRLL